jgi:hypothetical protein
MGELIKELLDRSVRHDLSKTHEPERAVYCRVWCGPGRGERAVIVPVSPRHADPDAACGLPPTTSGKRTVR